MARNDWRLKPTSQLTDEDMARIEMDARFCLLADKLDDIKSYVTGEYRDLTWQRHEDHIKLLAEEAKQILNRIRDAY